MDSSNHPKSDPSILLLNEIEILLTQSRLLELYAKQAQTAAAHETARVREQHLAELAVLRSALADKEQVIAARETAVGAVEQSLREQVQSREHELAESRHRLHRYEGELQRAEFEDARLRELIRELEAAVAQAQGEARESADVRTELESELSALRKRLEKSEQIFHHEQLIWRELESDSKNQLARRDEQIKEIVTRFQAAERELQQARSEIAQLHERIDQLQANGQEAGARAMQELETARAGFAADLSRLQAALAEREQALEEQQSAAIEIERALKAEILTLRSQLDQQQELIGFRNDELRDAQSQFAALQQRAAELEATNQRAVANAEETSRLRQHYENELTALQHEVAIRERALTERQEAVTAVELALHGKIQSLQQELARGRNLSEELDSELQKLRAERDTLLQRIGQFETSASAEQAARQLAEQTRSRVEAELSALRVTLAQRENTLHEQEKVAASLEARLGGELNQLRSQLEEQTTQLQQSRAELEQHRRQDAAARQDLKARLRVKDDEVRAFQDNAQKLVQTALGERESHFKSLEEQLNGEIARLQNQLEEQNITVQRSDADIEQLRAEIINLQTQNARSVNAREELEENLQKGEALRHELAARLQVNDDELARVRVRADEEKEAALSAQEARFKSLTEQLSGEISQLRCHLDERRKATEQANEEVAQLRAAVAFIEEQRAQTENVGQELERSRQESAALKEDLEARLRSNEHDLQSALSSADATKSQLDAKITQLQLRLAEKQLVVDSRATEIHDLKTEIDRLTDQLTQGHSATVELKDGWQQQLDAKLIEHEAQITAVRIEHQFKQQNLETSLAEERQRIAEYQQQVESLRQRSANLESELEKRRRELETAAAQSMELRSRLEELEKQKRTDLAAAVQESEQARLNLDAELSAARRELQAKTWAAAQQQATLENLALAHKSQIQALEAKIAQEQESVKDREVALEKSRSQVRLLEQRFEQVTAERQQAELATVNRAVQIKEEYGVRIADLERQLAQKASELLEHGLAQSEHEASLKREIDRLVHESREKNQILQDRNDELVQAKGDLDTLREQFHALELATTESEALVAADRERLQTEFQAQLALLQAELSQKEWALEEQRAATSTIEQQLREKVETTRQQMADNENQVKELTDKFVLGVDTLTNEQRERFKQYDDTIRAVISDADPSFPASENRRWRSRFSWKRRWKSS
jgi:chromosome segregation ATPase